MKSNLRTVAATAAACGLAVHAAWPQGTFQNLDFERARVPAIPAGQFGADVFSTDGLPGWTTYIGPYQVSTIFHNNVSLGGAAIAILGPDWFPEEILQGRYTVLLQPSMSGPPTGVAIAQTGQVPSDAQSIWFYGNGGFTLSFAGRPISLFPLGSTTNATMYGGDVSLLAGQMGELRFEGGGWVDNIFFSNQPIPEPSPLGLFALVLGLVAGVAMIRIRQRR